MNFHGLFDKGHVVSHELMIVNKFLENTLQQIVQEVKQIGCTG